MAEQLFARGGFQGVTTREITEGADQRNASAVTYHFGTREGLLLALLARRGAPVDEARGRLRDELGDEPTVTDLVRCLVAPYATLLSQGEGRSYVRIVAQLRGRFAAWRLESDATTTRNLSRILDELEQRPAASPAVQRERVLALIMLLTGSVAERARRIDDGHEPELDHEAFTANLVGMCTALIEA